jgi:hypothetical protein
MVDLGIGIGIGLDLERICTTSVSVPRANTSCEELARCECGTDTTGLQAARGLS